MKVEIEKKTRNYQPDYSRSNKDWKVKARDAFTVTEIEGVRCFVKRFTQLPSAYKLLGLLKKTEVTHMPKVYDFVEEVGQQTLFYLFLEYIAGNTLREYTKQTQQKKQPISQLQLRQLAEGVREGFRLIHERNYWFTDFNEENVFIDKNNRFYLIDVDSCSLLSDRPNEDANRPGGMPGAAQEYAHIVIEFYRRECQRPDFVYQNLDGKNMNYLQWLVLVTKYLNYTEYRQSADKPKLVHNYLLTLDRALCFTIFNGALNPASDIEKLVFMFVDRLLKRPVIEAFGATHMSIRMGTKTQITWRVSGADIVTLLEGKKKLLSSSLPVHRLPVSPHVPTDYVLAATNKYGTVQQRLTIQVRTTPKTPPFISFFAADKTKVKEGQPVELAWEVKDAQTVVINGNKVTDHTAKMSVIPSVTATYTLIATNDVGKTEKTVTVTVRKRWFRFFTVLLLLTMALAIWPNRHSESKKTPIRPSDAVHPGPA